MKMVTNILVNSRMEICMGKVNLYKQMELGMKENLKMINDMEMEYLLKQMEKNMKVNLKIIKRMDLELKFTQMEKSM